MKQHLKTVVLIDYIYGGLLIFLGVMVMAGLLLINLQVNIMSDVKSGLEGLILMILAGVGLFMALYGLFIVITGLKIGQSVPWSRTAQLVVGVLALPSFPLGTAFGVFSLWVMTNKEITDHFKAETSTSS